MNPTLKIQKDLSHLISNGFFPFLLLKTLGEKIYFLITSNWIRKNSSNLQKKTIYINERTKIILFYLFINSVVA